MSFQTLNTYCAEHILQFLSKEKISMVSRVFPEQKETTDSYWKGLRVVNFDVIIDEDREAFMRNLHLCTNLKKLRYMKPHPTEIIEPPLNYIIARCLSVEILEIRGTHMTAERLPLLSFCDNLKSLTASISSGKRNYRSHEFFDRIQLQHLGMYAYDIDDEGKTYPGRVSFLEAVAETQTSLKSFECDHGEEPLLEQVFSNNKNLEDVTLKMVRVTGSCLTSLPKDMKRLDVTSCSNIDTEIVLKCLQLWNLESLGITFKNKVLNFMERMIAGVPMLKHLVMDCSYYHLRRLPMLENLTHLQTLKLHNVVGIFSEEFTRILGQCVDLRIIEIKGNEIHLGKNSFASIAELPKLEELCICSSDKRMVIDLPSIQRLTTQRTLISATFEKIRDFRNEHIVTLIRDSNHLKNLILNVRGLRTRLMEDIHEALMVQKGRTKVLNLTLINVPFLAKDIPKECSHPLLKLTFKYCYDFE